MVVIPFSAQKNPSGLEGEDLDAWVEELLSQGYPNSIEIPYYFDGKKYDCVERVIEEVKTQS